MQSNSSDNTNSLSSKNIVKTLNSFIYTVFDKDRQDDKIYLSKWAEFRVLIEKYPLNFRDAYNFIDSLNTHQTQVYQFIKPTDKPQVYKNAPFQNKFLTRLQSDDISHMYSRPQPQKTKSNSIEYAVISYDIPKLYNNLQNTQQDSIQQQQFTEFYHSQYSKQDTSSNEETMLKQSLKIQKEDFTKNINNNIQNNYFSVPISTGQSVKQLEVKILQSITNNKQSENINTSTSFQPDVINKEEQSLQRGRYKSNKGRDQSQSKRSLSKSQHLARKSSQKTFQKPNKSLRDNTQLNQIQVNEQFNSKLQNRDINKNNKKAQDDLYMPSIPMMSDERGANYDVQIGLSPHKEFVEGFDRYYILSKIKQLMNQLNLGSSKIAELNIKLKKTKQIARSHNQSGILYKNYIKEKQLAQSNNIFVNQNYEDKFLRSRTTLETKDDYTRINLNINMNQIYDFNKNYMSHQHKNPNDYSPLKKYTLYVNYDSNIERIKLPNAQLFNNIDQKFESTSTLEKWKIDRENDKFKKEDMIFMKYK